MDGLFFLKLRTASKALSIISSEPITKGAPGNWKKGLGLVK